MLTQIPDSLKFPLVAGLFAFAVTGGIHAASTQTDGQLMILQDFETGSLQKWNDTGCGPSEVVQDITRHGKHAVRMVMDRPCKRAELAMGKIHRFPNETEYWLGFSNYVPNPEELIGTLFQFHTGLGRDKCDSDLPASPELSLRTTGDGTWYLHNRVVLEKCWTSGSQLRRFQLKLGKIPSKKWTDWVINFSLSHTDKGILRIWKDGQLIVDDVGKPNHHNNPGPTLFKAGLYHTKWKRTDEKLKGCVIYYDEFRLFQGADGYDMVAVPGSPKRNDDLAGPGLKPLAASAARQSRGASRKQ